MSNEVTLINFKPQLLERVLFLHCTVIFCPSLSQGKGGKGRRSQMLSLSL